MLSPGTGTVRKRLGRGPGTLLDVSRPSVARPGRPKIGLGASFGLLQAAPSASGRVPDTAVGAQDGPRLIFRRFLDERAWIFIDFRSIFRRFSPQLLATKPESEAQKRVVRSMLPDLALALCIRFVLLVHLWKCHSNVTCSAFFRCVPTSPPSFK